MSEDSKLDMPKTIEYVSKEGYKGVLYNWHYDDWSGEWHYSMSVRDETGREVLHSYNAKPTSKEELKNVVDGFGSLRAILSDELAMRESTQTNAKKQCVGCALNDAL